MDAKWRKHLPMAEPDSGEDRHEPGPSMVKSVKSIPNSSKEKSFGISAAGSIVMRVLIVCGDDRCMENRYG